MSGCNVRNGLTKGKMFHVYVGKLVLRTLVFLVVLWGYFNRPELFEVGKNHIWVYIIWFLIMVEMIVAMLPDMRYLTMGSKKGFSDYYVPVEDYDELSMHRYVQKNNYSAIWVLIVWMTFNAIFGALYVLDIIAEKELILLSVFFYLADLICVVIWCPFQSFFMKNKCCVNCRIFNWGHFMMCTPLLFIRNFFTWSLFFTSLIVMLRWELTLLKHPERFWEGSNATLKCANCQDKICKFKGPKFVEKPKS